METLILTRETKDYQADVVKALHAAGFAHVDGWFYPAGEPRTALVRIDVYGGQYQLFRRRTVTSPWMRIAVYDVQDFSAEAFRSWVAAWPLASAVAG